MSSVKYPIGGGAFVQAKHYTWKESRDISLIVIHSAECADGHTSAEAVAAYFAGANAPQASAHVAIDCDSVVGCVLPKDIAWAVGPSNAMSYSIELCGYARWTAADWSNHAPMLTLARQHIADTCTALGVARQVLSDEHVADALRGGANAFGGGVTTHAQLNRVWRKYVQYSLPAPRGDTSHSDPGLGLDIATLVEP